MSDRSCWSNENGDTKLLNCAWNKHYMALCNTSTRSKILKRQTWYSCRFSKRWHLYTERGVRNVAENTKIKWLDNKTEAESKFKRNPKHESRWLPMMQTMQPLKVLIHMLLQKRGILNLLSTSEIEKRMREKWTRAPNTPQKLLGNLTLIYQVFLRMKTWLKKGRGGVENKNWVWDHQNTDFLVCVRLFQVFWSLICQTDICVFQWNAQPWRIWN